MREIGVAGLVGLLAVAGCYDWKGKAHPDPEADAGAGPDLRADASTPASTPASSLPGKPPDDAGAPRDAGPRRERDDASVLQPPTLPTCVVGSAPLDRCTLR